MMYRVLLLQGGEIYCRTLLIPEMGKENFFLRRGVSGPLKKEQKIARMSSIKSPNDTNHPPTPPLPFYINFNVTILTLTE
jgi:hypothetical protein